MEGDGPFGPSKLSVWKIEQRNSMIPQYPVPFYSFSCFLPEVFIEGFSGSKLVSQIPISYDRNTQFVSVIYDF
jgi:hypothetical protein